jgi:hypothetical protein
MKNYLYIIFAMLAFSSYSFAGNKYNDQYSMLIDVIWSPNGLEVYNEVIKTKEYKNFISIEVLNKKIEEIKEKYKVMSDLKSHFGEEIHKEVSESEECKNFTNIKRLNKKIEEIKEIKEKHKTMSDLKSHFGKEIHEEVSESDEYKDFKDMESLNKKIEEIKEKYKVMSDLKSHFGKEIYEEVSKSDEYKDFKDMESLNKKIEEIKEKYKVMSDLKSHFGKEIYEEVSKSDEYKDFKDMESLNKKIKEIKQKNERLIKKYFEENLSKAIEDYRKKSKSLSFKFENYRKYRSKNVNSRKQILKIISKNKENLFDRLDSIKIDKKDNKIDKYSDLISQINIHKDKFKANFTAEEIIAVILNAKEILVGRAEELEKIYRNYSDLVDLSSGDIPDSLKKNPDKEKKSGDIRDSAKKNPDEDEEKEKGRIWFFFKRLEFRWKLYTSKKSLISRIENKKNISTLSKGINGSKAIKIDNVCYTHNIYSFEKNEELEKENNKIIFYGVNFLEESKMLVVNLKNEENTINSRIEFNTLNGGIYPVLFAKGN